MSSVSTIAALQLELGEPCARRQRRQTYRVLARPRASATWRSQEPRGHLGCTSPVAHRAHGRAGHPRLRRHREQQKAASTAINDELRGSSRRRGHRHRRRVERPARQLGRRRLPHLRGQCQDPRRQYPELHGQPIPVAWICSPSSTTASTTWRPSGSSGSGWSGFPTWRQPRRPMWRVSPPRRWVPCWQCGRTAATITTGRSTSTRTAPFARWAARGNFPRLGNTSSSTDEVVSAGRPVRRVFRTRACLVRQV